MKKILIRIVLWIFRHGNGFYIAHRDDAVRTPQVFSMGRYSYAPPRVWRFDYDTARLTIGAFCSIAYDAIFMLGGNHHIDRLTTFPLRLKLGLPNPEADGAAASRGDIVVGNDVWVGADALILSGVKIGNGAVVGARAVVASDVRPYAIVVGNPAREIRRRFTDAQIAALESIAWWNWPIEKIRENAELINGDSVDEFISRFGNAAAA